MMQPTYLGDGLYAKFENFQFVLMANSPKEPTDTVYLEYPEIYEAFVKFAERVIKLELCEGRA